MAKSDVERLTDEKIGKGGVLIKLYFDIQNKDREQLQPLLLDLINERLLKEAGVVYCYGTIDEPLEQPDGLFITNAVVILLVENVAALINISFKYSPAGIEVLKPRNSIEIRTGDLQSMAMDVSRISLDYSKYILERVLKPEDAEAIIKEVRNRMELGKKMIDEKDEKKGQ